jgi:hypothetical protein
VEETNLQSVRRPEIRENFWLTLVFLCFEKTNVVFQSPPS